MGINIGLDIGGVSLKLAAIGGAGDAALLDQLAAKNPAGFFPARFPASSVKRRPAYADGTGRTEIQIERVPVRKIAGGKPIENAERGYQFYRSACWYLLWHGGDYGSG